MATLNNAWTAASEEMYKASQQGSAAQPDGSGNAGNAGGASNNSEATDVDFEEVKEDKK
jgi:molecular chaperone DnaK